MKRVPAQNRFNFDDEKVYFLQLPAVIICIFMNVEIEVLKNKMSSFLCGLTIFSWTMHSIKYWIGSCYLVTMVVVSVSTDEYYKTHHLTLHERFLNVTRMRNWLSVENYQYIINASKNARLYHVINYVVLHVFVLALQGIGILHLRRMLGCVCIVHRKTIAFKIWEAASILMNVNFFYATPISFILLTSVYLANIVYIYIFKLVCLRYWNWLLVNMNKIRASDKNIKCVHALFCYYFIRNINE